MTRRLLLYLAVSLIGVLGVPTVSLASLCNTDGTGALGIIEIGNGEPQHTFYLDDRAPVFAEVYVYVESNGIFVGADPYLDLQRGGESPYLAGHSDPCVDDSTSGPDTLIF